MPIATIIHWPCFVPQKKKGTLQNSNVFSTKARSLRQSVPWLAGKFPIEFHDFPSDFLWIQWSRKCLSFPSLAAKTTWPSSSSWPWTLWDQASRPARLHNFGEVVWGWSARILIMQPMTKTTWQFHTQWRTIKQPINDCLPKQRYCFPVPNWVSNLRSRQILFLTMISHPDFEAPLTHIQLSQDCMAQSPTRTPLFVTFLGP